MQARRARDLARHEMIGLEAEVADSTDKGLKGLRGKIVDETKNTLVILVREGARERRVRVPKSSAVFRIFLSGEEVTMDGKEITYRPEDRIKKVRSRSVS